MKVKLIILLLVFAGQYTMAREFDALKPSQTLNISDGLTHNGVTCIIEDSHGFIWIATYDGINRYDGYEITTFKNTTENRFLNNNRVRSLCEDDKGNIWIGTENGITIYDYHKQVFKNIYSNELANPKSQGPIVRDIIIDENTGNVLCLTQTEGLLIFNKNYSLIQHHVIPPSLFNISNSVRSHDIEYIGNSEFIIATQGGLVKYSSDTQKISIVNIVFTIYDSFVVKANNHQLISRSKTGIIIVDILHNDSKDKYRISKTAFEEFTIVDAYADRINNKLWLGTLNEGLILVDNLKAFLEGNNTKTSIFKNKEGEYRSSCIYVSERIGCMAGTFTKGIYRFKNKDNTFKHYSVSNAYKNSYQTDNITDITELDSSRVMIVASGGGIGLFNTDTQLFEPLPFYISEEDRGNILWAFIDNSKSIWLQIKDKGLYRVNSQANKLELMLSNQDYDFLKPNINAAAEDKFGNIWLACKEEVCVLKLDKSGKVISIENISENGKIQDKSSFAARYIYVDPVYDYVWLGVELAGLYRIDNSQNNNLSHKHIDQFTYSKENPASISSNFVSYITRLSNNQLWVSTEGGGICKVLNSTGNPSFEAYSEKEGLSNHAVKNILEDKSGNLWSATNKGINKFDFKTNRFKQFTIEDGLPFEDFNYSCEILDNGMILFSGYNGLCYFKWNEVNVQEKLPHIQIDKFRIYNQVVQAGDSISNRVLLDKRISNTDKIELNHDENVFSLELKSLHYANAKNHFIAYQLLPVNEQWTEVPSDQYLINYNDLRPGNYTFRAKASNTIGQWSEIKELNITIKPPFWKTPWAILLYIIIVVVVGYIIIGFRLRILKLSHHVEIQELEKNQVEEVNTAKLRYFANISHEIKTPLTLISGPVEFALQQLKENPLLTEKLRIVQRQSKKIGQLIEQVHDFQRSDAEMLKMQHSNFSFDDFIHSLVSDYEFLAISDKKTLEAIGGKESIYINADFDKLDKIFNNLLNNAFKYTSSSDSIRVEYHANGNDLEVRVKDSGEGIDSDDLPFIFERFYQSRKKHKEYVGGSGIGLAFAKRLVEMHYGEIYAESELGKGTTFVVKLPVVVDKPDERTKSIEKSILSSGNVSINEFDQTHSSVEEVVNEEFRDAKIFLVEDNTEMRKFISSSLSDFFNVKEFVNGQELLNALEEEWPSIIISDVLMPQLNGFELCRKVKTNIKTSHIPIILLTACTSVDDEIQGVKEGADIYIKKPFNMNHLLVSIESLLRARLQLRERFQMNLPLTLSANKLNENTRTDNLFLEKLYQIISENIDNQDFEIDQLAKQLYLNRTHFYQKVKALTNQTPSELLKNYRVTKAAEYLEKQKYSVNEVLTLTGFKSRTHFTHVFKNKYGVTPGKFGVRRR